VQWSDPQIWASLLTLTLLEIVLGIDNLVFISILSQRVVKHLQKRARRIGLLMAVISRLFLLATASWVAKLTTPLITVFSRGFSGRDLLLIGGGLFLLVKATHEIHSGFDDVHQPVAEVNKKPAKFTSVITQIMLFDIIFSLDSVITAVGMAQDFIIMALAIIIAVLTMLFASEPLSRFIHTYPTLRMLALSFLLLVGMVLFADGFGFHIPRGYIYFAMGFSLAVETLNITLLKRR
jgi:predicted tellurium resistance membrane protein TerC